MVDAVIQWMGDITPDTAAVSGERNASLGAYLAANTPSAKADAIQAMLPSINEQSDIDVATIKEFLNKDNDSKTRIERILCTNEDGSCVDVSGDGLDSDPSQYSRGGVRNVVQQQQHDKMTDACTVVQDVHDEGRVDTTDETGETMHHAADTNSDGSTMTTTLDNDDTMTNEDDSSKKEFLSWSSVIPVRRDRDDDDTWSTRAIRANPRRRRTGRTGRIKNQRANPSVGLKTIFEE